MRKINIILLGSGQVGNAFIRLVREKQDYCFSQYKIHIRIGVVLNSRGGVLVAPEEQGVGSLSNFEPGIKLEELPHWESCMDFEAALECHELDVLVDCTPSNIQTGGPALGYTLQALDRGLHVVTANKGPLVVDFPGIRKIAEKNRVSLGMSGATAAALPTLDVALRSLAGTEILGIEGILNGTTNYVLTRMSEGMEYSVALKEAQAKGIAESNPAQDVEGWDTAAKILIITNVIFGTSYTLSNIHVEGITHIPVELREKARAEENALKLFGRFIQDGKLPILETKLSLIKASHPLFGVNGAQKGISFFTDTMDYVTVTGGKSDPRGAAAALLKDIINIYMG